MKSKKIFLVEDDLAIIDIYSTALKGAGFELDVITTGEQAVRRAKDAVESGENVPDVVLLDLILPDMNGAEALKNLKTGEKTKKIKVFILSNQTEIDERKSGGIKPDKFIIKADITPLQLVEILKKELS